MRTACSVVSALALIVLVAAPHVRAQDVCVGDCDGSGVVTINELILGVNIAIDAQPISVCEAFDCAGTGTVPINCLIQGVTNAIEGCDGDPVKLRTFEIAPGNPDGAVGGSCNNCVSDQPNCVPCITTDDCPNGQTCSENVTKTGLFASVIGNLNAALRYPPGPLKLELGPPDSEGIASLRLLEDVTLSIVLIDNTCFCFKLLAEDSNGTVACNGGVAYDTSIFQGAGQGPGWDIQYNQGEPAGPGNGELRVNALIERVNVNDECASANCATRDYPDPPAPMGFTTTIATARKGNLILTNRGEPFDCATFETPGQGILVAPGAITIDPIGDTAASIRLSEE